MSSGHRAAVRLGILAFAMAGVVAAEERVIDRDAVPAEVLADFGSRWPGAVVSAFVAESEDGSEVVEIQFTVDGREMETEYDAAGRLLETEETIAAADLPRRAARRLRRRFGDAEVVEVAKVTRDGVSFYEVELVLAEGNDRRELVFDADGSLEETEEDDDEDENEDERD